MSPSSKTTRRPADPPREAAAERLRRSLLLLFVFGLLGAAAELLFLEHFEKGWQWTPLILVALGLGVAAWQLLSGAAASVKALRGVGLALISGGLTGLTLHFRANLEFQRELYPSQTGMQLLWESLGGAMPALAPGSLVLLGLLALLYTLDHPALSAAAGSRDS